MNSAPELSKDERIVSTSEFITFINSFIMYKERHSDYNNSDYLLSNCPDTLQTHTRVHIIKGNNEVFKVFLNLKFHYDSSWGAYLIQTDNKDLISIFGRGFISSHYYEMEFNKNYNTLEIYNNYKSKESRIIIFPSDRYTQLNK